MRVKVVSSKLIKPCISTPPKLNKYKLSFIDENAPPMNVGVILFYPPPTSSPNSTIPKQRIHIDQLEESLSKILSQFYPLAGRYLKKDHMVDCSDQGVEFVEAEAVDDDVDFIDLVSKMEPHEQNDLLPTKFRRADESPTDPLMSIQVTEFNCGGLAISVSVSHRIFDASSVGTFIAAWSNAANSNNPIITICPSFESQSLFPGMNPGGPELSSSSPSVDPPSLAVKKFSFNKDAIKSLKSNIISKNSMNISRVRVVCAVIAKALMGVDRAKHGGKPRPCLIVQAVNIRGRTIPPIRKHSCGNLSTMSHVRCESEKHDESWAENIVIGNNNGIQELVDAIGDCLEKTIADCSQMFSPGGRDWQSVITAPVGDFLQAIASDDVNVVMFSDWSKFGFYAVDFGWGQKPLGVRIGAMPLGNTIVLMDSKEGDGIEAWVHLNSEDMAYFVQDQDIKLYTV